ncbi:MAG TPA: hypothetical protein VFH78_07250 [Candidatus Thermoplasmatota archaeon]|nr:hypothetical protein [Candidatus Thermoplasmatota archaeon]
MRILVALVAALFLVPTGSAVDWDDPQDALAVTVLRYHETSVIVSWSVAPGAVGYHVFRGPTPDDLQHLAFTPHLQFADTDAPDADTWYVVVSEMPSSTYDLELGPMRGKCVSARGITGISVTLAHCVPMRWP